MLLHESESQTVGWYRFLNPWPNYRHSTVLLLLWKNKQSIILLNFNFPSIKNSENNWNCKWISNNLFLPNISYFWCLAHTHKRPHLLLKLQPLGQGFTFKSQVLEHLHHYIQSSGGGAALWLTQTPPVSSRICCPAYPLHYHYNFTCKGRSEVGTIKLFLPLLALLPSLSFCLFVSDIPLSPWVMMTLSGGE